MRASGGAPTLDLRLSATLPRRVATGEVVAIGTNDLAHLGNAMDVLARAAGAVVSFLVVAAILLDTSMTLGLVVLIGVPLLLLAIGPLLKPLQRRNLTQRDMMGDLANLATDIVSGLRILRGIGGERVFHDRYVRESQKVRRAGVEVRGSITRWISGRRLVTDTFTGTNGDDLPIDHTADLCLVGHIGLHVFVVIRLKLPARPRIQGRDEIRRFRDEVQGDAELLGQHGIALASQIIQVIAHQTGFQTVLLAEPSQLDEQALARVARAEVASASLRRDVLQQMQGLNVVKVKIYDVFGTTVFSTDPKQIGEDKSGNEGFLRASAGGVASEITFRNKFDAFEQVINDRSLVASYIPLHRHGSTRVEAVMEVYSDVTDFVTQLEETQWQIVSTVLGSLTLLYLLLLALALNASPLRSRS